MTLDPLLFAPASVQIHVIGALCAIVLGPVALWRRSRDRWHRRLGYAWVIAMAVTALSSFAISQSPIVGPFGVIHILSALTVLGLIQGVNAARRGRIAEHRGTMRSLYFWAMGVAGLFTFLPGRRINAVFFAKAPVAGFVAMAGLIGGGLIWYAVANRDRVRG